MNFCGAHRAPLQKKMPAAPASPYTRQNPFPAKLVVNRSLCGEGSEEDTRHFELDPGKGKM